MITAGTGEFFSPAVPPNLTHIAPALRMLTHTGFVHGVPSPSRILQSFHSVSARPQKSIQFFISTTLPPSAALYRQRGKTYSLFFNGLIVANYTLILSNVNTFLQYLSKAKKSRLQPSPRAIWHRPVLAQDVLFLPIPDTGL